MGLFNFIYKLTNILSNKKKLRIFFIIAIVVVLVFCWSRGAFAATPEEANALTNYQLCLQQAVFGQLTDMLNRGIISPSQSGVGEFISNLRNNFVFIETSVNDNAQFLIRLYRINRVDNGVVHNSPQDFTIDGSWEIGINAQGQGATQYPCKLAEFRGPSYVYSYGSNPFSTGTFVTFYLPDACFGLRSNAVNSFLDAVGMSSGIAPTYSTNDAELQAIASSGFQNQVNAINNMNSTMQDVNSSVEDVNQSVQDVNQSVMDMINTIVDPYVNVSQEQLPQSNVQDSTEEGLDNIFIIIKNAFTGTPQSVTFPIPFTNQSFTIEPGFTENSMKKGGLNAMVSVIHLYWYYRIYSFIFLKYVELLEKLKEGEFEETVGNIKKEVL